MAYTDKDVIIALTFKHATDNAILVNDGDNDHWLPRSHCSFYDSYSADIANEGETHDFIVSEWLAGERGLI